VRGKKKLLKEVRKWVEDNYFNADHLVRSAYWVKELDPKADEAVIIAALTHDMERAFPGPDEVKFLTGYADDEYIELYKKHSLRSAKIVGNFLKEKGVKSDLIKKVKNLIKQHEIGGTYEQNLVKDADSISFLEINVPTFISFIPEKWTKEEVRKKFEWMFNRISLPKAKQLAKPFYEKAIAKLIRV